jgi:hypothetical protein
MLALMGVILLVGYDLSKKKLQTVHTDLAAIREAEASQAE